MNCKDPANPKPVEIYSQTDRRYNPSDLAEFGRPTSDALREAPADKSVVPLGISLGRKPRDET